jgi:ABC-type antimicrobial peptide transport system permease subunit
MRAFYTNLRTALQALRRNVTRSALTCLGIVIGIASVIVMAEIGQGTSHAVRRTIATLGANFLQVEPGSSSSSGVHSGAGTCLTLTPEDCEAILRECSAVRWAAPGVDCRMQIIYGNHNWQPWKILGTSPDFLLVRDRGVLLKVVGLLGRKGANMMGLDQDDVVLAPWTTVKFRLNGSKLAFGELSAAFGTTSPLNQVNTLSTLYPNRQGQLYPQQLPAQAADTPQLMRFADLDDIYVSANSPEEIPEAIDQIAQLLRKRYRLRDDQPDDFGVRNWTEVSNALGSTSRRMTDFLLCVALISLAAGGVGIMNIMLVSVTERTREIGIRLAVGARARDVRRQFLTEAVVLCLFGGVAGIVLGRGVSFAVTALLHWPTVASLSAVVAAVVVSVAVGIAFGYYPAWKASRVGSHRGASLRVGAWRRAQPGGERTKCCGREEGARFGGGCSTFSSPRSVPCEGSGWPLRPCCWAGSSWPRTRRRAASSSARTIRTGCPPAGRPTRPAGAKAACGRWWRTTPPRRRPATSWLRRRRVPAACSTCACWRTASTRTWS